jgi:hypothetical protein
MTILIVLAVGVVVIGLIWLLFAPRRHIEAGAARDEVTDDPDPR